MVIEPYDPEWPARFRFLRDQVMAAVEPHAQSIEHVGSTSVPGMTAKPIIDIDIVIRSDRWDAVRGGLEALGYEFEGDLGVAGREAFKAKAPSAAPAAWPAHHLYVCPDDGRELPRHLAFRDYLRRHPGEVRRLSELKRSLAATCKDVADYQEAKAPIVEEILARALEERGLAE